ncbi:hypothetical protein RFI02_06160 [Acinetobacter sichuanensis]|uniref:hypothetical protein n=1 Tax=Acinetobacter sichuanensis TaxID=2136183 RepID=UPI00280DEF6A|nr:hypothetical protein [Acinetobacter sichuanensis]MDQ9020690.1 hypothetical protein [Acinetobacter sichuanensis]
MKKLKHLYLRPQDPPFIWLASFVFIAKKEQWTKGEIQKIVQSVKHLEAASCYQTLTSFIENHK